ncbi:MAG: hypothetical protein IKW96_06180 [Ruminococcus sp.]|uniref:hypothetical protein n=1 Tax=Ruminococcus sp. TaxID=41978 RepID=UPI0025E86963|nr:hypothetical protein [Ruminococcus sp.]MBR5682850.1 hypothetical protein [Ruminococcus sp.]
MKLLTRIITVFAVLSAVTAAWGCEKKQSEGGRSDVSATASSTAAISSVSTEENKAATTSAVSTEPAAVTSAETTVSTTAAETTAAAETTTVTTVTTEQKETEAPKKGFDTCIDAARAYYDAYLRGDPNAVYDMFCEDEIEGYHAYLDTEQSDLLEGKNAQVMFKRSKVISAINDSIKRIHSIMSEKSSVPPEQWTTSVAEQTLKATGENELKDFNKQLGTHFTNASGCGYVYYKDGNEEHDFLGNSCGFVELDGRWYLSYSTVMHAELLTYMDIYR